MFHCDCTSWQSHQCCTRIPFLHILTLVIVFLMTAILISLRWHLIVVLICISFMISGVFLCMVWESSSVDSFTYSCLVFPTPFIKSGVFSHYMLLLFLSLIDHLTVGLCLGCLFSSIDLCVCFYVNILLFWLLPFCTIVWNQRVYLQLCSFSRCLDYAFLFVCFFLWFLGFLSWLKMFPDILHISHIFFWNFYCFILKYLNHKFTSNFFAYK